MEPWIMETTLISARDLKNTKMFSKTRAFAVAWISNNNKSRQWTPVDNDNGTDPTWNQVMNFILNEADLQQGHLLLEIAIYTGAIFGDKEIGRVCIPLKEFFKPASCKKRSNATVQFVSYQVRKPSGKPKGVLNLSVKLIQKPEIKQQQEVAGSYGTTKVEPVTAHPVYPPACWSSHPPLYPPVNNQYPPPSAPVQAIYPPPPPYYQGYHPSPPPPYYQAYPPYQGYPTYNGYPPYQGYPPYNHGYPPFVPAS